MANLPILHKILSLVLFSATKLNTGDFLDEVIRILMAPSLMEAQVNKTPLKKVLFTLFPSEEKLENKTPRRWKA